MTKIAIIVEGATEKAFVPALRRFLEIRVAGAMPKLRPISQDGRIPKEDKLKRLVSNLLRSNDHVIAISDVYTGTADFKDADDAKRKMRNWVGPDPCFHPHVALHDFEAWLLPYRDRIKELSGSKSRIPTQPETVNHGKPPSYVLQDIFRNGPKRQSYVKTRDSVAILNGQDITVAAHECPELQALLDTILACAGGAKP